ncbi:hypothetical protein BH23GEM10_BH23GEM10_02930 [soil metagenome]
MTGTEASAAPTRRDRFALRALQVGAVAVVLVAATWKDFELDRFFMPKELVLHATALIAGVLLLRAVAARVRFTWVDACLVAYLALGVASAVLATNPWAAVRALTITASGLIVFWAARALRGVDLHVPLLRALALAVIIGAATSLLQTYGVESDFFSINRAPGGTLGNRNFIAHMAAFGLPALLWAALASPKALRSVIASAGATLVAATLILTRSRAGWLALAAVLAVFLVALIASPALRTHGRTWLRTLAMLGLAAAGVAGALVLPNDLRWRGENPYLDSVRGVANYQEGSGAGRLVQYRQSLAMAARHPVLGVGPGNWPVEYADHAAAGDPSMSGSESGVTSNPWPSSDWVAFASERGFPALVLLTLAMLGILLRGVRRLFRARDPVDALSATALIATLLATIVAGTFDAVLLLALPTLIVWAALGALWGADDPPAVTGAVIASAVGAHATNASPRHVTSAAHDAASLAHDAPTAPMAGPEMPPGRRFDGVRRVAFAAVLLIAAVGTLRSAMQVTSMGMYSMSTRNSVLSAAALLDPGSYRLRVRLARPGSGLNRASRCAHARTAHALYPNAGEAARLARSCPD